MGKTNPNGANQYTPDEREQKCWDFYIESLTKGTPNAYESAIKAGYTEDSSKNITLTGWFLERKAKLKRRDMLGKAEKVLDKTLDGRDLKLAQDTAKFVAKTLGKDEGYSERHEHTGKDGSDLFKPSQEEQEAADKALQDLG